MNYKMLVRSLFLALAIIVTSPLAGVGLFSGVEAAQAQTVQRISITGNTRVDDPTVISYLTVRVGEVATTARVNSSTEALLASGLFSSVNVSFGGGTLNISVSENPIVASVLFEGNQRFSDDQLLAMVDMASRGIFTDDRLATDEQSIKLAYDQAGYTNVGVDARTEVLENDRIRVIFVINEGERAGIAAINFTGNNTFRADQLKGVIQTRESHLLSWLFSDDKYDEDMLAVDAERIRIYYANRGFPDAQVLSAVAEFDASRNAYFINFTISEGERYTFGDIAIETSIYGIDTEALKPAITTYRGSRYSAAALQKSAEEIAFRATGQGYAFADVRPRLDRDIANRTFNITYLVDEGARVYVERINITGNEKTRDFVIRRELDFAEGDPFNRSMVSRGKSAIEGLGYFSTVNVTTDRGSSADKVVINIAVVETSTGDYGATVGYSSTEGILGEVSLTERNFLGRGQYLRVAIGASQSGQTYDFSFTEPRFMGLKISAGIDLNKRIVEENASNFYGTDSLGGQVRFGIPVTEMVNVNLFAGYESKRFMDADAPNSAVVTNGQTRDKAFVGYTLVFNGVDDVQSPTTGLYATFTQQYVGLDNNYIKTEARGRYFLPLLEDSGIVASVKGQAGIINDLSGSGNHTTESYQLGPSLVRGFEAAGMGPRAATGEGLGATYYAGVSAELEFPIPVVPESYGLRGAIWADAGYVGTPSIASPAATGGVTEPLRASVGASVIWESPFGPLRGDFAHVVQKDAADRTQVFQLTLKSLL